MTEVLVLGAGMVGVSTALALQARGHTVVLVDRKGPGLETSFGNAGIIQVEAAEPYALPREVGTLAKYALGQTNDVTWSLGGVLSMASALWSYFRNSAPGRHAALSRTYAGLTGRAARDHAPLIAASGSENLIARDGLAQLYRDPRAFEADARKTERIFELYGVTSRIVDGQSYLKEEPAFTSAPAGVIHWDQSWRCSDPGGLTAAYAVLFERLGGTFVTGDAASLRRDGAAWCVDTVDGVFTAQSVVIALGPWSPKLLAGFGYRIPMVFKRGYHGHFKFDSSLRRPFLDVSNGVVAASMRAGLRISTGAQLVPQDAPADPRQLVRGCAAVGELLDLGPRVEEAQWFGTRPCLPGMLPLVGPAPKHSGLWFNFGHGHQGFTLGPTTAALLADAFDGETEPLSGLLPAARL